MDQQTIERIEQIKSRLEGITEGPWGVYPDSPLTSVYCEDTLGSRIADCHGSMTVLDREKEKRNAKFLANARQDIPFLLDLLEKAGY